MQKYFHRKQIDRQWPERAKNGLEKIMQIFIQEKKIISFVGEIHFPQTITKPKRIFVFWLTLNRYPEKTPP